MNISINVVNQHMCVASTAKSLVAGSQQFVKFKFNLTEEWDGLVVFAQFQQNGKAYNQFLDKDNCVYLPSEISAGVCSLVLYGSCETTIGTTDYLTFRINKNTVVPDAGFSNLSNDETVNAFIIDIVSEVIADKPGQTTAEGGEIFNDYENNKALGTFSHSEGTQTQAGSKAFTVEGINKGNRTYTLDSVNDLAVGDVYSVHLYFNDGSSGQKENVGKIEAIDAENETVTVDVFYTEDDRVFATPDSYINEFGVDEERNTFRIVDKPWAGTRNIGFGTHSEGQEAQALSKGSHAEGDGCVAYGSWSHAEGKGTKAGYAAHAEGKNTTAAGFHSHAEGTGTTANGWGSHTEGDRTETGGTGSHAEGQMTKATANMAHAEGSKSIASGVSSHAEGTSTESIGNSSHSEGLSTKATAQSSHAEGTTTEANGSSSHAEGNGSIASGSYSHAEGNGTTASGTNSHTEGNKTVASNQQAHAEGNASQATGSSSHAEGAKTQAIGAASHAEGGNTIAEGNYSHAEGTQNSISSKATAAHVGGNFSKATASMAFAHGYGVTANQRGQTVFGLLNETDSNALFIVANGTGGINSDGTDKEDVVRSNAFVVKKDGTGLLGNKQIATQEYVDKEIATFDFIKVVDTLPETGLSNKIYLVPKTDADNSDLFDEYIWANDTWEFITTKIVEVDLTDYATKDYVKNEIANAINAALEGDY